MDDAPTTVHILLVEDDPGDVTMTREALLEGRVDHRLTVAEDGEQALDLLLHRGEQGAADLPDLILLDLNLPRISGLEVLDRIKQDAGLRRIPVIVLTTSQNEDHVLEAYDRHANAYVSKPMGFDEFVAIVHSIDDFFVSIVRLPGRGGES